MSDAWGHARIFVMANASATFDSLILESANQMCDVY